MSVFEIVDLENALGKIVFDFTEEEDVHGNKKKRRKKKKERNMDMKQDTLHLNMCIQKGSAES